MALVVDLDLCLAVKNKEGLSLVVVIRRRNVPRVYGRPHGAERRLGKPLRRCNAHAIFSVFPDQKCWVELANEHLTNPLSSMRAPAVRAERSCGLVESSSSVSEPIAGADEGVDHPGLRRGVPGIGDDVKPRLRPAPV